jgi:hypothetical protein
VNYDEILYEEKNPGYPWKYSLLNVYCIFYNVTKVHEYDLVLNGYDE